MACGDIDNSSAASNVNSNTKDTSEEKLKHNSSNVDWEFGEWWCVQN